VNGGTMTDLLQTPNLGTGTLEDRDRVDFAALRRARADRVFDLMDRLGLDVCVFGREANARYASGTRRLWTALSRPFAPTCVAVRATRSVHLLSFSASYEGIPEELQPDQMYPLSWNPMHVIEHLKELDGAARATRVGVDGMTSLFDQLLRMAFPAAAYVGVEPDMRALRSTKLDAEVTCLRIAAATAEAAMVAAIDQIRPGSSGRQAQAAFLARMCQLGTSQFAQQGTFTTIADDGEVRFLTTDEPFADGAPVAAAGGVLWAGYEGSLARTWWSGRRAPDASRRRAHEEWRSAMSAVTTACRPGASGADLMAALEGASVDLRHSAVYSIGLGHDGPIAASWLGRESLERQTLSPTMVLGVRVVTRGEHGAHLGEDMVLVTDRGVEALTTLGYGPLAG
jgi:Xaa-Pro dipeptidase